MTDEPENAAAAALRKLADQILTVAQEEDPEGARRWAELVQTFAPGEEVVGATTVAGRVVVATTHATYAQGDDGKLTPLSFGEHPENG
jgi:hypothetical protein